MERLRLDALGVGGRKEPQRRRGWFTLHSLEAFRGQVFFSNRALSEVVAQEDGARMVEATGQAVAQAGPAPSWLQPAILAAPLLL